MKYLTAILFILMSINAISKPEIIYNYSNINDINKITILNDASILVNNYKTIYKYNKAEDTYKSIDIPYTGINLYNYKNEIIGNDSTVKRIYSYDYQTQEYKVKSFAFIPQPAKNIIAYTSEYIAYRDNVSLEINVYDLNSQLQIFNFADASDNTLDNVIISPDNKYIIGINDNLLFKYDISTLKAIDTLDLDSYSAMNCFFKSDSLLIAVTYSQVFVVNTNTFELVKSCDFQMITTTINDLPGDNSLIQFDNLCSYDYDSEKLIRYNLGQIDENFEWLNKNKVFVDKTDTIIFCNHRDMSGDLILRYNYITKQLDTITMINEIYNQYQYLSSMYYNSKYNSICTGANYYSFDSLQTSFIKLSNATLTSVLNDTSYWFKNNYSDSISYFARFPSKEIIDSINTPVSVFGTNPLVFGKSTKYFIYRKSNSEQKKVSYIYDYANAKILYTTLNDLKFPDTDQPIVCEVIDTTADMQPIVKFMLLPEMTVVSNSEYTNPCLSYYSDMTAYYSIDDSSIVIENLTDNNQKKIDFKNDVYDINISKDNKYLSVLYFDKYYGVKIYKIEDLSLVEDIIPNPYLGIASSYITNDFKYLFVSDNCSSTVYKLNLETSTVNEQNSDNNLLSVFPNPASNILNVKSEDMISKIEIYNISGELLYREDKQPQLQKEINIENLPSGSYYIKIKTKNFTINKSFIKN